ncbi:BTB/POZ domain-containing protein At3g05675 [Selaginella moellendorffii]|nr:BTB/POZ domain-containing protein At3g05675 [Selaginella moellendorffii]XP_024518348.1 BTB/POZ domain-containing protein At3g05675 [Selaginella moellendorffii]|eukprot:XP_024518347.1 BTB/POZ domain-containing protein At3g05675 [Selaginella moellendorffii]
MGIGGAGEREILKLGDRSTSDVIVRVGTPGRDCSFYAHSAVLRPRSSCLAANLAKGSDSILLGCCEEDFDYYVILFRIFYAMQEDFSSGSCGIVAEECCNVKTTIGVAKVATELGCEAIVEKCFTFLEGVSWNEGEEEEMLQALSAGICSSDDPVLARLRTVDSAVVREVFLSAIIAATRESDAGVSIKRKVSAQEQIEYMLVEDDDAPLITSDSQIKSAFREKFCELFHRFKDVITIEGGGAETFEDAILEKLADVSWASRVLSRLGSLDELVLAWSDFSPEIVFVFQDPALSSGIKLKVMEITSKVLEAVGYGNVLIPPTQRTGLVKAWLPFVRDMKMVLLEAECVEETMLLYNSIEAAINSLVLSLPSDDQGVILAEWLKNERASYPDLSEAFEVWCFRSKAAKRRLSCG